MNGVEIIKGTKDYLARNKKNKERKKIRLAAYCRVSTDKEDQLNYYKFQMQYYSDL